MSKWIRDHKGRIVRWQCDCHGQWHRPLSQLYCDKCRAHRPHVKGQEKPLDRAFRILDQQLEKDKDHDA